MERRNRRKGEKLKKMKTALCVSGRTQGASSLAKLMLKKQPFPSFSSCTIIRFAVFHLEFTLFKFFTTRGEKINTTTATASKHWQTDRLGRLKWRKRDLCRLQVLKFHQPSFGNGTILSAPYSAWPPNSICDAAHSASCSSSSYRTQRESLKVWKLCLCLCRKVVNVESMAQCLV